MGWTRRSVYALYWNLSVRKSVAHENGININKKINMKTTMDADGDMDDVLVHVRHDMELTRTGTGNDSSRLCLCSCLCPCSCPWPSSCQLPCPCVNFAIHLFSVFHWITLTLKLTYFMQYYNCQCLFFVKIIIVHFQNFNVNGQLLKLTVQTQGQPGATRRLETQGGSSAENFLRLFDLCNGPNPPKLLFESNVLSYGLKNKINIKYGRHK